MALLIAILAALALFVAFLLLTVIEKKQGKRLFGAMRETLDRNVARVSFIAQHADFAGALIRFGRYVVGHIAHDIAAVALRAVRAADRLLLRVIGRLRGVRAVENGNGSRFVKTISYFKKSLRTPQASTTSPTAETIDTVASAVK